MTSMKVGAVALAAVLTAFAAHSKERYLGHEYAAKTAAPQEEKAKASSGERKRVEVNRRSSGTVGYATRAETPAKAKAREDKRPQATKRDRRKSASAKKATRRTPVNLVAKGRKSEVIKTVAAGGEKYQSIVARYASTYGVPLSLAHAVIRVESNYRPHVRGRAGEVGLMQIKPSTARGLGYTGSIKALYDPETNIRWGMKYLGQAHKLGGGTTCGTILKYNAGHGAKRMNPVSQAYCTKVKRHIGS